ncbi:tRNA (guanine(46)-N(7))-methyltransferase TrmB [Pararhodobacter sp.]|uniref:tRNA (guanine(46)-N(7))-methyltransferase TrmB n=1 Tax=Pararhodobacter sp. TaxID=2127056 RepID=UPI002FDE84E1
MTRPSFPPPAKRNFYGRVHGKTLRPSQKQYLAEDMEAVRLRGVSRAENPSRAPLDLSVLPGDGPLWLEIGFGGGEHMVHMAQRYPQVRLIGCEPFVNGIAMALGRMRDAPVPNLRLHPGDARDLFDVLPEGCLERVFLNYPDPWPKSRHHRRRFVTPEHLLPLARCCAPGAEFRVATDIPDYVRQTLVEVPRAGFALVSQGAVAWEDWLSTRYEKKALREGRVPHYLTFRRS